MNVFEKITQSPETLAAFLRDIPAMETPWDVAFHRTYCDKCPYVDCDDCPKEDYRNNPLWYLGLSAEAAE